LSILEVGEKFFILISYLTCEDKHEIHKAFKRAMKTVIESLKLRRRFEILKLLRIHYASIRIPILIKTYERVALFQILVGWKNFMMLKIE
jgi:hypothetical protein